MDETPQVPGFEASPPASEAVVPPGPAGQPAWATPPEGWPPPPPPPASARSLRRWPKVAAAVGVATGTAIGAAVLAAAATNGSGAPDAASTAASSGSTTTTPGNAAPDDGPGLGGRARLFGGGPLGLGGPVLHGEFTITAPGGGYETLQEQSGTVTSVTNTSGNTWSLVVKSADGTSLTYVVDSTSSIDGGETGISSVSNGDTVRVLAVVSGGTSTVKQLNDRTVLKNNGQSWMPTPPMPPSGSNSSTSGTGTSA